MTQTESHRRVLTAFVIEHRDQLETYADSGKETTWVAEALLDCARADESFDEVQSK